MAAFRNTSTWKMKENGELSYSQVLEGKKENFTIRKQLQSIDVQLTNLSLHDEVSWQLVDHDNPEVGVGQRSRLFIVASGTLKNCIIHAITLDEAANTEFSRLDVWIESIDIEDFQEISTIEKLSSIREPYGSDGSWMRSKIGSIVYSALYEHWQKPSLGATLYLPKVRFEELADEIKSGSIRSAELTILAHLYGIEWEVYVPHMGNHSYNYAILCEDNGETALGTYLGVSGRTNACIKKVGLEWSCMLEKYSNGAQKETYDGSSIDTRIVTQGPNFTAVLLRVADDVEAILGRINFLFSKRFLIYFLCITVWISWFALILVNLVIGLSSSP